MANSFAIYAFDADVQVPDSKTSNAATEVKFCRHSFDQPRSRWYARRRHLSSTHKRRKQVPSRASKKVVYTAIFANIAIAACKYIAALFTGSSAMFAEAVHSTVDTGNELLLLLGMKRSVRPPDELHPYGHGKVLYFYSLLVAVYIFGLGGLLALHEGISHLRHPEAAAHIFWNYVVLVLAAGFDFYSWRISYREIMSRKDPNESLWSEVVGSKDPTIFTVLIEDSAGIAGAALAFFGILLDNVFHTHHFDPAASILVGVLLSAVAFFLGRESGALLVGERTNRVRIKRVKKIIEEDSAVEQVGDLLTMQLGPDQVLLTADIKFRGGLTVPELESAIDRIEGRIHEQEPMIERIFLEADTLKRATGPPSKAA